MKPDFEIQSLQGIRIVKDRDIFQLEIPYQPIQAFNDSSLSFRLYLTCKGIFFVGCIADNESSLSQNFCL